MKEIAQNLLEIKNKNIIIQTYTFESGLWYLAKSLIKILSEHNTVYVYPKEKYKLIDGIYKKIYPSFKDQKEFFGYNFISPTSIHNIMADYSPDIWISFETLMMNTEWLSSLKRQNVTICDVPMPEWVLPKHLENNKYDIFDAIYCLTDSCFDVMRSKNKIKLSWQFADETLFYPENKTFDFYHAASTNSDFSGKSTKECIEAFMRLADEFNEITLNITGNNTEDIKKYDKNRYKIQHHGVISREDQALLYRQTKIVLSPSVKEGLGLALYEAQSSGCKIVTTDYPPMNVFNDYLCKPYKIENNSNSLIKSAYTSSDEIYKMMKMAYNDWRK
jgi:glycosyltransferase involved in cell wall biosynthesis